MSTLLTIAGYDPSSGAGATADLMTFAAHGFFGTSVLTALTVQSTLGVLAVHPVEPKLLTATLDHLVADLPPAAIKIGMLANRSIVEAVIDFLARLRQQGGAVPVVLDPVLLSSSGARLLDEPGEEVLAEQLLGMVDWVTPNLAEARILAGSRSPGAGHSAPCHPAPARQLAITSKVEAEACATQLRARYPRLNLVITGGDGRQADDLLAPAEGAPTWLHAEKIVSRATHGTGCAFSSALAANLAAGLQPQAAAINAKDFVSEAIRRATPLGHGKGPLNLLWPLQPDPR